MFGKCWQDVNRTRRLTDRETYQRNWRCSSKPPDTYVLIRWQVVCLGSLYTGAQAIAHVSLGIWRLPTF